MAKRLLLAAIASFSLTMAPGCPDYSHLREEPDYKNMVDTDSSGGGDSGDESIPDEERGMGDDG